jgi:hypothetical protein
MPRGSLAGMASKPRNYHRQETPRSSAPVPPPTPPPSFAKISCDLVFPSSSPMPLPDHFFGFTGILRVLCRRGPWSENTAVAAPYIPRGPSSRQRKQSWFHPARPNAQPAGSGMLNRNLHFVSMQSGLGRPALRRVPWIFVFRFWCRSLSNLLSLPACVQWQDPSSTNCPPAAIAARDRAQFRIF